MMKYNSQLYFIVEEGQFNDGDISKALLMIELASKTGADAIEFQLAYADDFYCASSNGYSIYKNREFTDVQLQHLVDTTHAHGLEFIATCLSHNLVPKMVKFGADAININASDINNPQMLHVVARQGVPFFLSTPLATEQEIEWALHEIRSINAHADVAILHGQHTMASGGDSVSISDTSLGYIEALKRTFHVRVGFIDHTAEAFIPSVAVSAGAQVISKHLSPSHIYKGPDWQICLDPIEMKKTISNARLTFESINQSSKQLAHGEDADRSLMRRSCISNRKIEKGEKITIEDIAFKRPGTGVPPNLVNTLIGKVALVTIEADSVIESSMIE